MLGLEPIDRHAAVIGGGILGSLLALRLREQGFSVTLAEAEAGLGGLAASERIGGFQWDRFYHVILLSDKHTRALVEELGLADRLRWRTTRTGFFTDGKLYSMSDAVEFLRFPPLSLIDKVRLGATIFLASRIRQPRRLEGMLATRWLGRWSGANVLNRIWVPLLKSKLGENYQLASAAFIWAIIARMYAARRSGIKREMFGYLEGGYGQVHDALRERLIAAGVEVRTGFAVESIRSDAEGHTIRSRDGEILRTDFTVSTLSPGLTAHIAKQLSDDERRRFCRITYQGVVCASLLMRKPLANFYVTNITDAWVPFTGVIEMTALVDRDQAFGGNSLVYLPLYLPQNSEHWNDTDEQLRDRFLGALGRMYPHFDASDVLDFKVSRARQVLALSTLDYSAELAPPLATSVPSLYMINSAQITYGTLNINETLGLLQTQLPDLLVQLRARVRNDDAGSPIQRQTSVARGPGNAQASAAALSTASPNGQL